MASAFDLTNRAVGHPRRLQKMTLRGSDREVFAADLVMQHLR